MNRIRRIIASYRGRDLPPTVRGLGYTSLFQDIASDMVYPLLPGLLALLGGSVAAFGLMESAADGVLAIVKAQVGRVSDRAPRRRPFVIAGYSLSAALRPLTAIAMATWQVIFLRIADRVAKGIRTAPRDAMIADSVPVERRAYAFSFHRGLDHLGAGIGAVLASALLYLFTRANPGHTESNLRIVLAIATIPACVGVFVLLRSTDDVPRSDIEPDAAGAPHTGPPPKRSLRADLAAIPSPMYMPLAAMLLFSLGNASDGFLLYLLHDVGYPTWSIPLVWGVFHVVKYGMSTPGGHVADRAASKRKVMVAGWGAYALVYVGFALVASPAVAAALLVAYAVYYGLTEGAERALTIELAAGRIGHGSSLGAFHGVVGIGAVLSSVVFGLIFAAVSREAAFLTGAGLALAAAVLLAMTGRTAHELPHHPGATL